ncbi:sugar-transfer associated ATP-grasp domain-containing protein [Streptomyces sp. NPDC048717]|uniref:sugar-transfer associated ATP-grasp domain-containing protein n=1 Tax=Streptomyces sp. NPDC048717 TaxID=3154928 RepID=UPI00341F4437
MTPSSNRGFNHRQALSEDWFRARVLPRVAAARFLPHQIRQIRHEHLPVLLRAQNRKSVARMAEELLTTSVRWRCLPFHYVRYGVYRHGISAEEVGSYLPETVLFHRLLPRVNRDLVSLDDKVIGKRILAGAGIPQPALLACGNRRGGVTSDGRTVDIDRVIRLFSSRGRVVVKPARYSSGGAGIVIVRSGEEHFSLAAYARRWGSWLVEEHVRQHPDLDVLNPYALNTFRVITLLKGTSAEVLFTLLKLGGAGRATDNSADGGLQIRVWPDGRLDRRGYDRRLAAHSHHPVTSVPFAGRRIAYVDAVRELAARCAALFPQTPFIGWDIAVTPGGPVVIEGNSSPSLAHIQRTHGGVARRLLPELRSVMDRPLT